MLDFLRNPRLHMAAAALFLVACAVAWPLSLIFTPNSLPLILSLSWLALIIPAFGFLLTAKVEEDQENGDT